MTVRQTIRMNPTGCKEPGLLDISGLDLDRIAGASLSAGFHACLLAWLLTGSLSGSGESNYPPRHKTEFVEFVAIATPASTARVPVDPAEAHVIAPPPEALAEQEPDASWEPVAQASFIEADSGSAGSPDDQNDLLDRYHGALRARIESMWTSMTNAHLPTDCRLIIHLEAGGGLLSASAAHCALGAPERNQLEAAALMAQPMPYDGFESVFSPELELPMRAEP